MLLAMSTLDAQLSKTSFILGERLTLADWSVYHVVNFASAAPVFGNSLKERPALNKWLERLRAMDGGNATSMSQEAALDIARTEHPDTTPPPDAVDHPQYSAGASVTIQADDYGQEVTRGTIIWLRENELAVLREDENLGQVVVHYPRQGYQLL